MKKLMIAAAIVCAAAYANAANCNWGFTSDAIEAAPGSSLEEEGYISGGTALLYLGTIEVGADGALKGLDTATYIETSPQLGNFTFGSNGQVVDLARLSSDAANQPFTLILLDANGYDYAKLADYEGYAIVYNNKSDHGTDPMPEPGAPSDWAIMTTGTAFTSGSWQMVSAVPEPTSGLLLLLGVAGLALRRRRA